MLASPDLAAGGGGGGINTDAVAADIGANAPFRAEPNVDGYESLTPRSSMCDAAGRMPRPELDDVLRTGSGGRSIAADFSLPLRL